MTNVPGPLTDEEFETMMRDFDDAAAWMADQIARRHLMSGTAARVAIVLDADSVSDSQNS